jgi:hypothetical protein|tara:strand:+ start:28 stop:207 length:180 start_codon:yes stop_codon:yes gene_type:complete
MLYREDEEEGIICSICRKELLWNSDFDYDDYGLEGDGIVGHYTCRNKMCHVEDIQIFTK